MAGILASVLHSQIREKEQVVSAPKDEGPIFFKPVIRTHWMAGAVVHTSERCRIKSMINKHVYSLDMCLKQILKTSIRYNTDDHWVHMRCAGILLIQYTTTWTCHLHSISNCTSPNTHNTHAQPTHTASH